LNNDDKFFTCDDASIISAERQNRVAGWVGFSGIALCVTLIFALMIKTNKEIMMHPRNMIFYILMAECIGIWSVLIQTVGEN
jgi:ABC-type enterochelin transport system permease subunit